MLVLLLEELTCKEHVFLDSALDATLRAAVIHSLSLVSDDWSVDTRQDAKLIHQRIVHIVEEGLVIHSEPKVIVALLLEGFENLGQLDGIVREVGLGVETLR